MFPPQATPADSDICRHNVQSQIVTKEIKEMHSSWKKCCLHHLIVTTVALQLCNCKSKVSLRRLPAFCYLCRTSCINNQSDSVWAEKDVHCVVTTLEGVQSSCRYAKEHADVTLLKYEEQCPSMTFCNCSHHNHKNSNNVQKYDNFLFHKTVELFDKVTGTARVKTQSIIYTQRERIYAENRWCSNWTQSSN